MVLHWVHVSGELLGWLRYTCSLSCSKDRDWGGLRLLWIWWLGALCCQLAVEHNNGGMRCLSFIRCPQSAWYQTLSAPQQQLVLLALLRCGSMLCRHSPWHQRLTSLPAVLYSVPTKLLHSGCEPLRCFLWRFQA